MLAGFSSRPSSSAPMHRPRVVACSSVELAHGSCSESPNDHGRTSRAQGTEDVLSDFDMLGIEVVLGDRTSHKLNFVESAYLRRLLLTVEQPVELGFGSAALRHLTGNRALFMEVLELAARLEVEEVFEMLCVEFGCIYQKEVGSDFASRLLSSWSQRGAELREVDAYREKVARAFATDTRHLSPSLSHTSLFSSQVDRHGDVGSHRGKLQDWRESLKKDRYFFPEEHGLGDLTQSACPRLAAVNERLCVNEEFAAENQRCSFQNVEWEAEDASQECPVCHKPFISWSSVSFNSVRASHCRCCGRRICKRCTSWRLEKSFARLSKPGAPQEGNMRPVCWKCFDRATKVNRHAFLCDTFVRAGLSLADMVLLRSVSAQWKGAAELCLSDYRSSLYQGTLNSKVPEQTSRILANSVALLVGHPEPIILLLKSMDWTDSKLVDAVHDTIKETVELAVRHSKSKHLREFFWKPSLSHWHLLCTRSCGVVPPPLFAIKVLECLHYASSGHPVAEGIRGMVTQQLLLEPIYSWDACICECVLLLALDVFDMETCQPHATTVLLALAQRDRGLALMICQEAQARLKYDELSYSDLRHHVIKVDSKERPESHQQFLNTLSFLELLTSMDSVCSKGFDIAYIRQTLVTRLSEVGLKESTSLTSMSTDFAVVGSVDSFNSQKTEIIDGDAEEGGVCSACKVKPMLFPFATDVVITQIHVDGIVAMKSKQQPLRFPLLDVNGATHCVLLKRENLEKDKVMCVVSRFLQWVLHRELHNVVLPTYRVMLLSRTCGLIEIVENSQTVQHVVQRHRELRLLQYLVMLEEGQQCRCAQGRQNCYAHMDDPESRLVDGSSVGPLSARSLYGAAGDIQKNFLCSAKFFILLNYIFAIGDRHRDNVMVHPSGAIFHIDFGMLLTTRTLAERVTSTCVRFDFDFEECVKHFMGRDASGKQQAPSAPSRAEGLLPQYSGADEICVRFIAETADWFLVVRPYVIVLNQLISHIVRRHALDGVSSIGELNALMDRVFMRGVAERTCKETFFRQVMESRGQMWLKDFTHETQRWTQNAFTNSYQWFRELVGLDRACRHDFGSE
uniref:Putative phosphatidylinositol kinase n=1 Tax=Trypanosoma vivax (strain Y486) TaxID=1055687 RepID=G0U945_TRYVY|nr:putative phosphatidylinositol kinase, fragment [Trypanosoma vivax Y486]